MKKSQKNPKKLSNPTARSGRFVEGPSADAARFSESVSFDCRLWRQDIQGSVAHARMLQSIGVLNRKELNGIVRELKQIGREISEDRFPWKMELEDVHMNIEAELTRREPAGAKLHTGRSRNDQVALDMRLWMREEIGSLIQEIRSLQAAFLDSGESNQDILIPGYTHLQRAQPVYFAHHLLAYVEMLGRDAERLLDCQHRVNVCPLGNGALAGSTIPLNREMVALELGFVDGRGRVRLTRNSMDGISDRDYLVEFCAAASLISMHLSRLAEDLILWSSVEFNFIRISDSYTTGSSLMPQKKNPDMAELTRGKTGRVYGNLVALLTIMKGLPMTYNRDLQEDKERVFDTMDTVRAVVRLNAGMIRHISVNEEVVSEAVSDANLLATDLADYLVNKGVAFREAHHVVGRIVALSEKKKTPLNDLSLKDYQALHPEFGDEILKVFDLRRAMSARKGVGAPGTRQVKSELRRWRKKLAGHSD